jgi:hypothetical protein
MDIYETAENGNTFEHLCGVEAKEGSDRSGAGPLTSLNQFSHMSFGNEWPANATHTPESKVEVYVWVVRPHDTRLVGNRNRIRSLTTTYIGERSGVKFTVTRRRGALGSDATGNGSCMALD